MIDNGMCGTSEMRDRRVRFVTIFIVSALSFILATSVLWAGPPFTTDDPETPEYRHGEFYIASQYAKDNEGKSATAPHFEFNYAVMPDVMLHTIVPLAWNKPNDESSNYGLGDVELGVLYRFIHESDTIPQVGAFPILTLPTGDEDRGFSNGCPTPLRTFSPPRDCSRLRAARSSRATFHRTTQPASPTCALPRTT